MKTMKTYKFSARIEAGNGGGASVVFPYDVEKEFGKKGRVPVEATFDGVPYSGSMVKCGPGQHMLGILKAIRTQLGKGPGDSINVVLWKDDAVRTVEVPVEFEKLLKKQALVATFERLSYTHRREYCRWIAEAKREETRLKRLEKAVEMVRAGVKTPG
jgi:hypothetical protein